MGYPISCFVTQNMINLLHKKEPVSCRRESVYKDMRNNKMTVEELLDMIDQKKEESREKMRQAFRKQNRDMI